MIRSRLWKDVSYLELSIFDGLNKDELSMIEVAHAILEERADVMDFSDLVNQIQNYLGKSDSEIRDALAQFYTDLNIDGSFISLGITAGDYAHGMQSIQSMKKWTMA